MGDEVGLTGRRTPVRAATVRNHSGTHLLQWALRSLLGPQVRAGGLPGRSPQRLRFDFTHDDPLTDEQITEVEDLVNDLVLQNLPSQHRGEEPSRQAIEGGAIAMFGEKYGDVRCGS